MKQLDVLFVHANASQKIYQDLAKDFSAIEPPIWAGMLANHCRLKGFSVNILDCEALHLDEEAIRQTDRGGQRAPGLFCGLWPAAFSQFPEYGRGHDPG